MKITGWILIMLIVILFSILLNAIINNSIKIAEKRTAFLEKVCIEKGFKLQLEPNPEYVRSCLEIRDGIIYIYYYDELEGKPYLREGGI